MMMMVLVGVFLTPPSLVVCRSALKPYGAQLQTVARYQLVDLPHLLAHPNPMLFPQSRRVREVEVEFLPQIKHRQARNQSPELHLTFPFPFVQVKVASTGLSSLDLVPRAPSRKLSALPSPALPTKPRRHQCTSEPRVPVRCLALQWLFLPPPPPNLFAKSLMPSKSEFSRAISTWIDLDGWVGGGGEGGTCLI